MFDGPTQQTTYQLRSVTLDDARAVTDLINTRSQMATGANSFEVQEILDEWNMPFFDKDLDGRLACDDEGRVVAYGAIWNRHEPHVKNWMNFYLHPSVEDDVALGRALLDWGVARGRENIAKAKDGARVTLTNSMIDTVHQRMIQHIKAYEGFKLTRHFLMMQIAFNGEAPPEPVLPEGLTIRTHAEVDDLPALVRAEDECSKDHWGYSEAPFEELYADWLKWIDVLDKRGGYDPTAWFLVMEETTDGPEIVGMSLCTPRMVEDEAMAYVESLAVRRPWRKQGVGLALMHHSFGEFFRRGKKRVALHVDASSLTGATRLYEKAGMHIERQYDNYQMILREGKDLTTQSAE